MDNKFFVDFGFYYDDHAGVEPIAVDFAVLVGTSLDTAMGTYNFIWRNNINNLNIRYIQLRLEQQNMGIILSHRTPGGEGDW